MRNLRRFVLCGVLAFGLGACDRHSARAVGGEPTASAVVQAPPAAPKVYTEEILSPVYEIDRIYKSMQGPESTKHIRLGARDRPELIWVVGFEATMVAPDGVADAPQQFMCHTNMDVSPEAHSDLFPGKKRISGRLFTLAQGQQRIDFPDGYGIPLLSTELLSLNMQVLNLNQTKGTSRVRHRVRMRYLRDAELTEPHKPLFAVGVYGLKLLKGTDGHYGQSKAMAEGHHGTACLPGKSAGRGQFEDGHGRSFTGHWVVEPGREVNHTRVTDIMDLPFDTSLHYVAVHLHPFAESMRLQDLTTGQVVFEAKTQQLGKGIGLAKVDFFSSGPGTRLFKDHEYEVVSHYDNTSGQAQDSMAVFNLYLLDKEFVKPDLSAAAKVKTGAPPASSAAHSSPM